MQTSFSFSPRRVTRYLLTIIASLVFLYLVSQLGYHRFGWAHGIRLFNLDKETAFPAYFSALQLLGAAFLLALIAREHGRQRAPLARFWWVLTLGFCFLSLDEACAIHETFRSKGLEQTLHVAGSGYLYYPWVLCGLLIAAAVGAFFIPFLVKLPAATRWRFVLAGFLFVSGALGMELVGAKYASIHGVDSLGYILCVTVEESLEMVGVALFIRALLLYIATTFGACAISFGQGPAAADGLGRGR